MAYNRPGYGGGYGRGPGYPGRVPGYRPGWGYHSNWVNGYWGGPRYGGGWGGYGYNSGLGGFGLGMLSGVAVGGLLGWGLGSSLYGMGYSNYANPYYGAGMYSQPVVVAAAPVNAGNYAVTPETLASAYDYSQPINTDATPPEPAVADPAVTLMDDARAAFMAGDYPKALNLTDQALKTLPNDSAVHEFRALVLFALKQYDFAAGTLYAVLSVGPGWDWTTMIRLYPNVDVYTTQLRALETYRNEHPDSASAHFVLGYQYLTQGNTEAGVGELKEVARLKPQDHLASQLIAALAPPASAAGTGAGAGAAAAIGGPTDSLAPLPPQGTDAETPDGEAPDPNQPPDASAVAAAASATQGGPESKIKPPAESSFGGGWKSSPNPDVTIDLAIQPDKKFSWSVTHKGQTRKFDGEYTYGGDTLTLVQTNGTAMVGKLAWQDESHFNFRIAGTTPDDPGLNFAR